MMPGSGFRNAHIEAWIQRLLPEDFDRMVAKLLVAGVVFVLLGVFGGMLINSRT